MNNNSDLHLATSHEVKALQLTILDRRGCKLRCPQCGYFSYKVYVDGAGRMVDEMCGKCDRENSCDYHLPPREYYKQHPDAKRDLTNLPKPEPREAYRLPRQEVATALRRPDSVLVKWMKSLPWNIKQRNALDIVLFNYCVGTWENGFTTWWQVDEEGQIHSGKIMAYAPDGHRIKAKKEGEKLYTMDWIHSIYERRGLLDPKKGELVQCLFGQHLLKRYNVKKVHIVESEKSAVIAAAYYCHLGPEVWMACGGLQNFNRLRLLPLITRDLYIDVWPDIDGYDLWVEKAKEINYPKLQVRERIKREYNPQLDPDNADIADIILRKLTEDPQEQHY